MKLHELLPRSLWLAPLVLSLIFVLGVLAWVRANETDELDQQRQTLISDALSTEAQLRDRINEEAAQLRQLARALVGQKPSEATLASHPEVNAGLRRLWQSVTWLDGRNRVLAEVPERPEAGRPEDGLSLHLTAPVGTDGVLVVRYAPALMLKRGVPWWLARKYDVQLVDSAGA
jgi:two-component system sensor histidine kinase DctS